MIREWVRRMFPGSGAGDVGTLVGIILMAIGIIIGATLAPSTITSLVAVTVVSGGTDAADSMANLGQLVAVLSLTVGPALAGLYMIFKSVKG